MQEMTHYMHDIGIGQVLFVECDYTPFAGEQRLKIFICRGQWYLFMPKQQQIRKFMLERKA